MTPNSLNSRPHVLAMRNIQAVVLCGGLGTRLRPAVPHLPKSLAPVAGRPFLDYILSSVAAASMRDVLLCTGYSGDAVERHYASSAEARNGLRIEYSREHAALGTAGALRNARAAIRSNPFLVLNGDSLLEINFEEFLAWHLASGAVATLALTRVVDSRRYGSVVLDANGEVRRFAEKVESAPNGVGREGALVNAGVYALDRRVLDSIPSSPSMISLEKEIFPALIGRDLFGFVTTGFFIDIGVPEEYQRAQTVIPRRSALACSHSS
jgi:D-glycero-alpha-D-manno-heptose 1-phosphate guanylyltransferase